MKSIVIFIYGLLNLTKISADQNFCESDKAGLNKCHDGGCNNPESKNDDETCICNFSKGVMKGKYCGVYENQCLSNPCKNNGKCISGIGHHICECSKKFHGSYCEIPIKQSKIDKKKISSFENRCAILIKVCLKILN